LLTLPFLDAKLKLLKVNKIRTGQAQENLPDDGGPPPS
jgi:hypothetical protein